MQKNVFYIAEYEIAGQKWLQAAVSFPLAYENPEEPGWSTSLAGILRGCLGNRSLRPSFRVNFTPNGIQRTIFLSAPRAVEQELRKLLGRFLRLNLRFDDYARLPYSRASHDLLVSRFPRYQCMLRLPTYHAGDAWLACDFNLRGLLPRLVTEAAALGYSFAYHTNFEPFSAAPALLRQASRNFLSLRERRGVPQALITMQERLLSRIQNGSFLGEEILGASDPDTCEWLSGFLRAHFDECCHSTRLDSPDFQFHANACEDSLTATRHRAAFEALGTDEILSSCVSSGDVQAVLAWAPPGQILPRLRPPVPSADGIEKLPGALPAGLPAAYNGNEDYIFISYKIQDLGRIAPVLRQLTARGKRVWYDKGIPGGAEWNAVIEERLERCKLLMLFVSTAAIKSSYVRREAQFAALLEKPILGVKLENAVLSDGMKLLLSQYQVIDLAATSFHNDLERAIQYAHVS